MVFDPFRNIRQPQFGSRPIGTVVDNVSVLIWDGIVFHGYRRPQRTIHQIATSLRQRMRLS